MRVRAAAASCGEFLLRPAGSKGEFCFAREKRQGLKGSERMRRNPTGLVSTRPRDMYVRRNPKAPRAGFSSHYLVLRMRVLTLIHSTMYHIHKNSFWKTDK
jgi:hypothetical protein